MSKAFPDVFYHSISQNKLKITVENRSAGLPGLSRFHLDPERKMPGVWISDNLPLLIEGGYGNEQSEEIIGEFKIGNETISVKKPVMSIILQLEGLDEEQILQHPILPEQFFYIGDIPWINVKKMLVRQHDEDAEKTARELAERLKRDFGAEIGIETFDPNIGLERKWGKKFPEIGQPEPERIDNRRRKEEDKIFEKNILPKDREIDRY